MLWVLALSVVQTRFLDLLCLLFSRLIGIPLENLGKVVIFRLHGRAADQQDEFLEFPLHPNLPSRRKVRVRRTKDGYIDISTTHLLDGILDGGVVGIHNLQTDMLRIHVLLVGAHVVAYLDLT